MNPDVHSNDCSLQIWQKIQLNLCFFQISFTKNELFTGLRSTRWKYWKSTGILEINGSTEAIIGFQSVFTSSRFEKELNEHIFPIFSLRYPHLSPNQMILAKTEFRQPILGTFIQIPLRKQFDSYQLVGSIISIFKLIKIFFFTSVLVF